MGKIIFSKMKLSLFIAGVAFAAPNNVQSCMKHVINNDGPVMERAMGAVACLERSDAYIQPGQCWVKFLKTMEECEPSFNPGECFAKVNPCVFGAVGSLLSCS